MIYSIIELRNVNLIVLGICNLRDIHSTKVEYWQRVLMKRMKVLKYLGTFIIVKSLQSSITLELF